MKNSKLIKIFTKPSLKIDLKGLFVTIMVIIIALSLYKDYFTIEAFGAYLALIGLVSGYTTLRNIGKYSTFYIYEKYMICNNPLFFWNYKKLFYYHKIEYISIYNIADVYGFKVHLLNGKTYTYRVDINQAEELINLLRKFGVKISIEVHNYQPSS